jgi:hypothetical protein
MISYNGFICSKKLESRYFFSIISTELSHHFATTAVGTPLAICSEIKVSRHE